MKKVAIMQPYFFPYLGYFSLIKHTDEFILFDPVQFIRHGWIERNRILKQNEGWLYIKVPLLGHDQATKIKDIKIDNTRQWQQKIVSQLQSYKKIAPYYEQTMAAVNDVFEHDYDSVVELNRAALLAVCRYLEIDKSLPVFSDMNLSIETPGSADEWALNICKALGDVDEYWNPPGGQEFFDAAKYQAADIKLVFQTPVLEPYDQKRQPFEAGLSILDIMMFNSPEEIHQMLDNFNVS